MQHNYHNISQTGRRIAGMTQERWAEALDISVESVRLYESGRGMPSDDVATRMAEVSGAPVLGYWHLLNKSRVAADLLPQGDSALDEVVLLDTIALPQAVIQLLRRIRDFDSSHRIDRLVDIAEDGRIDQDERPDFEQITRELDGIVQAAMQLKYARGGDEDGHADD